MSQPGGTVHKLSPRTVAAGALFAAVAAALLWLVATRAVRPGDTDLPDLAPLADFRDTVWYPVRDLLAGNNPYDLPNYLDRHPGAQPLNPYSPAYLLVTAPIAALPYLLGGLLWTVLTIACTPVLVALGLRSAGRPATPAAVLFLSALLLPLPAALLGVVQGQVAPFCAVGAILAVWFRDPDTRGARWAGAAGLAVALVKPQVGIPLVVLMLAYGSWRTVLRGTVLHAVVALPPTVLAMVAAGGPGAFVTSVLDNASQSRTLMYVTDLDKSARLDLAGLLGRVTGGVSSTVETVVALLTLAATVALAVVAARRFGGHDPRVLATAALVVVIALPNERYALLAAVPAIIGLAVLAVREPADRVLHAGVVVGLLIPFGHARLADPLLGLSTVGGGALDAAGILLAATCLTAIVLRAPAGVRGRQTPTAPASTTR